MKYFTALMALFVAGIAQAHSEVSGVGPNNHILEDGQASLSFRLISSTHPSRCLVAQEIHVQVQGKQNTRQVVQWSDKCADEKSVFRYEDGGGFTSFMFRSDDYVMMILRPDLPKIPTTPLIAENLFVANTVEQAEFTNGISIDLFLQPDGTYVLGDNDEEDPKPISLCLGENTKQDGFTNQSIEVVSSNKDKKSCAHFTLKKI
jgi:hypothetical protein